VTDTTSEDDVARLFERAMAPRDGLNTIDLIAYNAGNNQRIDFREMTAKQFEDFWWARSRAPACAARPRHGHFHGRFSKPARQTGLYSVRRGKSGSADDRAEHGARIWAAGRPCRSRDHRRWYRWRAPARVSTSNRQRAREDGMLNIDAIAEIYGQIHRQPRSAWTHEVDLRPFKEPF
jgi:hypothetical protein